MQQDNSLTKILKALSGVALQLGSPAPIKQEGVYEDALVVAQAFQRARLSELIRGDRPAQFAAHAGTKLHVLGESDALSDNGNTITCDGSAGNFFEITLGGNRTLAAPTNPRTGSYVWILRQDGVGGRVLNFSNFYLFPDGADAVLSEGAGAVDLLSAICGGGFAICTLLKDCRAV